MIMISKNELRFIKSLHKKSERDEFKLFVAEGTKLVTDLIKSGGSIDQLLVTKKWATEHPQVLVNLNLTPFEISESEMERITGLSSPSPILAVFHQPNLTHDIPQTNESILLLDDIRDPGNMGTIIRTADWFGIKQIVCSPNTVDCFNSKVIQSTMGSIMRVKISYQSLPEFILANKSNYTFYGTFMNGNSINNLKFVPKSAFIIGNEAHGISPEVETLTDQRIAIPGNQLNDGVAGPESLNAAIATSVVLYDWFSKK